MTKKRNMARSQPNKNQSSSKKKRSTKFGANIEVNGIGRGGFQYEKRMAMPSAFGNAVHMPGAQISGNPYTPGGTVRVKNREFIMDLDGATEYGATSFLINPGNVVVFPWLSNIATSFEEYRFTRLCLRYETYVGTDQKGSVMIAWDYDVADDVPISKQELLAFYGAIRCPAWSEVCAGFDTQKANKWLFVKSGATPAGMDPHLYDVARLIVAVQGFPEASGVGELYLEYEVDFRIPQKSSIMQTSAQVSLEILRDNAGGFVVAKDDGNVIAGDLPFTIFTQDSIMLSEPGSYYVQVKVQGGDVSANTMILYSDAEGSDIASGLITNSGPTLKVFEFAVAFTEPLSRLNFIPGGNFNKSRLMILTGERKVIT